MIPPKGWAGTKGAQLMSLGLHLSEKNRLCLPGPSPPSCTPAPAPRQFLPSGAQLVGCFPSSPPSYPCSVTTPHGDKPPRESA